MNAEIITIGDEILIGQIVDTNSAYIGKQLNKIGVSVYQITSIQDEKQHILNAFKNAEKNADIIIVTGGLGPTKDDITKHTLATYFNDFLVENKEVLNHVENLFAKYISTPISDLNRQQAMVLSQCEVLKNDFGTAPGMWIEKKNKVFISLPGVPYEMKGLIANHVLPKLQEKYKRPHIFHKTILTVGLGESAIAQRIENWETNLPQRIKLAYLPSLGKVRLRLSTKGIDKDNIESEVEMHVLKLLPLIEDIFVGFETENTSVEQIVASRLVAQHKTIAFAESTTGGKLTEIFTKHPGASHFLKGSIVTYATQSKIDVLNVSEETIKKYSVVSEPVAKEMAEQTRLKFNSDVAVSTTGNAGPKKGDSNAEVGTVCIAIATKETTKTYTFNMGNHREKVINKSVTKVLELLQKEILIN
jgi:nicotinamide-nucleotide amidase